MNSTMPPSRDARHPYHIPPTYFGNSGTDNDGLHADSQPGPSISRRRSSLQPPQLEARGSLTDSDMFRDAEDDAGDQDYDLGRDLLSFNPPPARTYDGLSAGSMLSSPYQPHAPRPPDQSYAPVTQSTYPQQIPGALSPGRDRLPSSNSMSSMSSTTKSRRAPAPAALNLSPRREARNPYEGLGHGVPSTETRRVATEPVLERMPSQRDPRPLPHLPPGAGPSASTTYRTYSRQPSYNSSLTAPPTPLDESAAAMPLSVPLSAVGDRHVTEGGPPSARHSLQPSHTTVPSIDSYYSRSPPRSPGDPGYLQPQALPHSQSQTLSPASPYFLDPSNIDRRGLIGVGELATPRWTAAGLQRHTRTPSLPLNGMSPPMPPPINSLNVGSAPQNWAQREAGLGLGVGQMDRVAEESPAREQRVRHQSMSISPPRPKLHTRTSSTQPNSARDGDLEFATLLGTLDDFEFDSSMEAALAASLAIPDERSPTGPTASAVTSPVTSTFPPFATATDPDTSIPLPSSTAAPTSAGMTSPGSARSRIYARRAEREKERERSMLEQSSIPTSMSANLSPPHSADSSTARRDSRKTPPAKEKETRYHQSPSHDILKHFAPKDFSHLPPSPSSASINQFLRGSASHNNFAAVGAGNTPPGMSPSASYFTAPTRDNRGSLPAPDSQKTLNAGSWSREVDADTAEALRKLDGLGSTPGKAKGKSKMSTGVSSINSRSGTPPRKTPTSERRLNTKASVNSVRPEGGEKESPLNNWLDLGEDLPAIKSDNKDGKRESSSSASVSATSRDSHSLPTSTTTPSSTPGKVPGRRGSDGSITSQDGPTSTKAVPPVPPLPKGYMSMRSGLSAATYVPMHDPSNEPGPSTELAPDRPKQMSKKWSFSSALNLKLGKESPSSAHSPAITDASDDARSPDAPWSEIQKSELPSPFDRRPSNFSNETRSNLSVTPVAQSSSPQVQLAKTTSGSKRLGPSSIPFFRRTSSSSSNQKGPAPALEPPKSAGIQSASTSSVPQTPATRKSVLGMHLPSMLRGSSSKRGLSQQLQPQVEAVEPREVASTGWTGRQRGKTLSMTADEGQAIMRPPRASVIKHQPSIESTMSNQDSRQSSRTESTINGNTIRGQKPVLPAIIGSPALKTAPSSGSLRTDARQHPSATPTKIPRIVSRTADSAGSMPPPASTQSMSTNRTTQWSSKTMANASSMNELARASITEFGTISAKQQSSGSHRAHLLQPMSTRDTTRSKVPRSSDPPMRRADGTLVPPSRRTLPIPPSAAAPTISSSAKRSSREFRPAGNRLDSKEKDNSGSDKGSRNTSPIKPSKSMHSKLSIPATSTVPTRISPSSSVGAPGMGFRKSSLVAESPAASPAEDEEALADNEMQAYIRRRRARAQTTKKDDMADVTEFPSDTDPSEGIPQRAFIKNRLSKMTDFERKEVLDYETIYFSPQREITRPADSKGQRYNHGYDDERGDYLVVEGDHMCYRYEVGHILGKGSFGQVVQARDHTNGQSVAIKIIRNKKRFHAQALVEVKILQQLCEWDPEDKHYMVRMTDHFYFRSHLCIVTELLSINLYELIKANNFSGFSTTLVRRFTTQMLASLQLMRSHRIVHCDLKPENILLCHPIRSGIKVIDFGSSCLETEKVYTYIQSRFYRSPEVILGMNYAMAIDMWSLGCILAELYTGVPIFPGENEHEQLACIMEIIGVPDHSIINRSSRRKLFFDATGAPRPFVNAKGKRRRPNSKTLAQVLKCNDELFIDFISKCLTWDPDRRMKPGPAMRHPWILAGRRRAAPITSQHDRRTSSASGSASRSYLPSTNGGGGNSAIKAGSSAKQLVISPPTPLVAKAPPSASRVAHSMSTSKLSQPMSRTSSFKACT